MASLNKIIVIGNLTADPEMRFTVDGKAVTKFSLAVQRPAKSDGSSAGVDYIPVVTFERLAEIAGEYLKKGKQALVEGRIQERSYTTAEGQKKWSTEIVASVMTPLDGMNETVGGTAGSPASVAKPESDSDDGLYDDIPF